ncbi:MAG: sigma-54-dependent Fis family transcriptional regulator [Bacteroidales bacterium]|nr:sigma-54-dependent Fis family transcriptional regulator [Bacteroidales bacterium]
MDKLNIMVLDDEPGYREEIYEYLSQRGFQVHTAGRPSEAFTLLETLPVDIAIIDIRLPEMNGLEVLQRVKKTSPSTEAIMITGHGDMESAIQAIRHGAFDFFNKPFRMSDVLETIQKSEKFIRVSRLLRESSCEDKLWYKLIGESGIGIVAVSKRMQQLMDTVNKVALSKDTTVLITGESGVGKELVARAVHYLSERKSYTFFPVNCSAVPPDLFESEFFGHKKGAFTGAIAESSGWFKAANKGTLFLDEISELKPELQSKFLRVIEDKSITMLGSRLPVEVDVRIVAATNKNLKTLVAQNKFREDLFFRLNAFVIEVPPLRARREEIPALFNYFVGGYSKKLGKEIRYIDKGLQESLMNYDFPGNVRELKNMVERAVIMTESDKLYISDFPVLHFDGKVMKIERNLMETDSYDLEKIERNYIKLALERTSFNKSGAAKLLNVSRQALDRKMKKYHIGEGEK